MEERIPYRLILILENIPYGAQSYQVKLDSRTMELTDDEPIVAVYTDVGVHNIEVMASPTVRESTSFRIHPGQMITKIFVRPTAHKIELDIDIGLRSGSFRDSEDRAAAETESRPAPAAAPAPARSRSAVWTLLLIFMFLLGLVCGLLLSRAIWPTRTRTPAVTLPPQTTESPPPLEDYAVEIQAARRTIDDAGDPAIVISYTWTNTSGGTVNAAELFRAKAFQDGVQLDTAAVYDIGLYDPTAFTRELRPDATLELQAVFRLMSESSVVEFEVTPLEDVSGTPVLEEFDPAELE